MSAPERIAEAVLAVIGAAVALSVLATLGWIAFRRAGGRIG